VNDGEEGFRLIVRPYAEVLTLEPIGAPVPDRGGPDPDIFITGLMYETRISDLETNEPLHLENGMWLNLGETQEQPIARIAAIPHGDTFLALGSATTISGAPDIPTPSAIPYIGPEPRFGYTDPYLVAVDGFSPGEPNTVLQKAIEGLTISETIELSLSTDSGGGVLNIPFVQRNANTTAFSCTFWIETVQDQTTGDEVQQLQYTQQSNLEFLPQFGDPEQLIVWPHVNVNTLRKQ
jgi:hypothetical protein